MAHIAVITSGLSGILHASFELINRLEKEGHQISCLSIREVGAQLENRGIPYRQLPDLNRHFAFRNLMPKSPLGLIYFWVCHLINLKTQLNDGIRELHIPSYEKELRLLNPDRVIIDEELHELIFAAYSLKIPITLISQFFCCHPHTKLPPINSTIRPDLPWFWILWVCAWAYKFLKIGVKPVLHRVLLKNNRRAVLKFYARKVGFPTKTLVASNFPSVYLHRGLPVLTMTFQEIEFPYTRQDNISYIGAMVAKNRGHDRAHRQINRPLHDILAQARKEGSKIIYCSVTTMNEGGDARFIQRVIEAVKGRQGWVLIISTGAKLSVDQFGPLPTNTHLFAWVPQLEVLRHSHCSINHGGIHTIHECLLYAVPMIVYSGKRYDQNGNAARLAYRGLSIIGDKDRDSVPIIREKISKVLTDHAIKANMAKYQKLFEAYGIQKLTARL
jgi:UDP:flavonoid glycosyltransferase YjiC (YdhE family)